MDSIKRLQFSPLHENCITVSKLWNEKSSFIFDCIVNQWVYVPTFAHASDDIMQLPNNNLAYLLANYLTLY